MSQRLNDVVKSNLYLFDLLFRHQVYLEGVKAGLQLHFLTSLRRLYEQFAQYLGETQYDNMDEFTRVELLHFIYRFQQAQTVVYNQYTQQLVQLLKQFVGADINVTSSLYQAVTGKGDSQHTAPVSADDAPDQSALWGKVQSEIVPANGLTVAQMIATFGDTMRNRISSQLNVGYANNYSVKSTIQNILGTKSEAFRNGLFSLFASQSNSLIATIIQHASSIVQADIAAKAYKQYQWVAILDSRTTQICLSRNGNVYTYGDGPLPPAHYNCRSKAVSLTNGDELHDLPASFYGWLKTQPEAALSDMLGATIAAKIVAGAASVKDISVTDAVIPLTVAQFGDKITAMLM